MCSFAELPEELWQIIVFSLEKRDVSVLSRSCKRMRERTIPYLYQTIHWTWNSDPAVTEPCNPPIYLLLRSLVENRHLGAYVQYLQFKGSKDKGSIWQKRSPGSIWPKCTADQLKALKDYVHEEGLPSETLWITALETGNVNVFVALVLSQLCNLCTIHLSTDFYVDTPFLGLLFKRALFSSPPLAGCSIFGNLQLVDFMIMEMDVMPEKAIIDADQVTSLFYLPAIQTISAVLYPTWRKFTCPGNHYPTRRKFTWPGNERPHALTLTTLVLPCCEVDETALLHMTSAAPNLHTLRYDYACRIHLPRRPDSYFHFDLAKLGRALGQVRTTLTHLSVSVEFYTNAYAEPGDRSEYWGLKNRLGGLQGFCNLESLSIPFVILFGLAQPPRSVERLDGILPRSIRRLYLRDDLSTWDDYEWSARACLERLEDFLADRKGTTPALERLDLMLRESHIFEWDEDEQAELREMCEGAGVQCDICKILPL